LTQVNEITERKLAAITTRMMRIEASADQLENKVQTNEKYMKALDDKY